MYRSEHINEFYCERKEQEEAIFTCVGGVSSRDRAATAPVYFSSINSHLWFLLKYNNSCSKVELMSASYQVINAKQHLGCQNCTFSKEKTKHEKKCI